MEQALSPLEDASQWYMGGTKEMRECVPGFLKAEKKIEAMVELSKFSKAVKVAQSTPFVRMDDCDADVYRMCTELQMISQAWEVSCLPVAFV